MSPPPANAVFARPAARGKERLFQLLVEQTELAIIFLDRDGTIEHWNPGAEALFGYSAAEVAGKPFEMLFGREDARGTAWRGKSCRQR